MPGARHCSAFLEALGDGGYRDVAEEIHTEQLGFIS
jgi:hypothetical protein